MEFDGVYKLRTFSDDFFTLMKTMGKNLLLSVVCIQDCGFIQGSLRQI